MFVKLQPEQISCLWDAIKVAIVEANNVRNPDIEKYSNHVLEKLMAGKAQVWVVYEAGEAPDLVAIAVTCFMKDQLFDTDYLLIHSVYAFSDLKLAFIHDAMKSFAEFAVANNCYKIVAMTTDERLLKLYERLGFSREIFVYSKTV